MPVPTALLYLEQGPAIASVRPHGHTLPGTGPRNSLCPSQRPYSTWNRAPQFSIDALVRKETRGGGGGVHARNLPVYRTEASIRFVTRPFLSFFAVLLLIKRAEAPPHHSHYLPVPTVRAHVQLQGTVAGDVSLKLCLMETEGHQVTDQISKNCNTLCIFHLNLRPQRKN
jgi:hypothetical protein